ncbi:MAG TPA: sporulation integral membrane protein YtvI [Bacillota bacterium]|nr:sporulation integral membrane protein YtvI [Bacillota bacterium]
MEVQRERKLDFVINAAYFVLIAALAYVFVRYLLSLISPFLLAFVIAYLLERPAKLLSQRLKLPMKAVTLLLVLVFYSVIGLVLFLLGAKLVSVVTVGVAQLPSLYSDQLAPFLTAAFESVERLLARLDADLVAFLRDGFAQFVSSLGDIISDVSKTMVGHVSNFAVFLPSFMIKVLLMVISTFFFAGDTEKLSAALMRQFSPRAREVVCQIRQYLFSTLLVVVKAYLIIMTVTFTELAIGLSIVRIPNAVLIALLIAIFDILPVLGTGGIMIPWIIVTFFQGNYPTAIGLLVVYVIITIVRNILEPKIVGGQLGLHPAVAVMSMFVGASLFGIVGLFGVPITLSLLVYLNDTGTIRLYS